jgi:hypothetical protein
MRTEITRPQYQRDGLGYARDTIGNGVSVIFNLDSQARRRNIANDMRELYKSSGLVRNHAAWRQQVRCDS